jgi:hypothetical protein
MAATLLSRQAARQPVFPPDPRVVRLEEIKAKRRAGEALTESEKSEVLDLLMGV